MKLKARISIDIRTFFLKGTFDYIEIGQTKEWILQNFADPDDFSSTSSNMLSDACTIWRYGNIEFHFNEQVLQRIFCDYIYTIDGGNSLTLDTWILATPQKLTLLSVIEILNNERVAYSIIYFLNQIQLTLDSGVVLGFDNFTDNHELNINKYQLAYFSLSTTV